MAKKKAKRKAGFGTARRQLLSYLKPVATAIGRIKKLASKNHSKEFNELVSEATTAMIIDLQNLAKRADADAIRREERELSRHIRPAMVDTRELDVSEISGGRRLDPSEQERRLRKRYELKLNRRNYDRELGNNYIDKEGRMHRRHVNHSARNRYFV